MDNKFYDMLYNILHSSSKPKEVLDFLKRKYNIFEGYTLAKENTIKNVRLIDTVSFVDPIIETLILKNHPKCVFSPEISTGKFVDYKPMSIDNYVNIHHKIGPKLKEQFNLLKQNGITHIISISGYNNCLYDSFIVSYMYYAVYNKRVSMIKYLIDLTNTKTNNNTSIFDSDNGREITNTFFTIFKKLISLKDNSLHFKNRIFEDFCLNFNEDLEIYITAMIKSAVLNFVEKNKIYFTELFKILLPEQFNLSNYINMLKISYINSSIFDVVLLSFVMKVNINFIYLSQYGIESAPIRYKKMAQHVNLLAIQSQDLFHSETFVYDSFPIQLEKSTDEFNELLTKSERTKLVTKFNDQLIKINNLKKMPIKTYPIEIRQFHKFIIQNTIFNLEKYSKIIENIKKII